MSELEIQRRQEYKRNRKRWTWIQLTAIILLAVIALGSFLIYQRMNRTYYIEYTERGNIDYKVQYDGGDGYFEVGEWLEKDQTYVSQKTNDISADFLYDLCIDSTDIDFTYEYSVSAKLLIANKDSGSPYYTMEEVLVPTQTATATSADTVSIRHSLLIDYDKYNDLANNFLKLYNVQNVSSSTLIVTMNVDVVGTNKQFDKENRNFYSTALNIPLAVDSYNIFRTSGAPEGESKILEYKSVADRDAFLIASIVSVALAGLLAIVLLVFLHLTRNEDITYAAKIRRLLNFYGSYIQKMNGEFDYADYQVVIIKTFNEMLGIRDTIQSPILMSENRDETMTRFFIPTNTKLLYVFEIKVDNYDAIYGRPEEEEDDLMEEEEIVPTAIVEEPVVEEPVEEPVIEEPVVEEPVEEPVIEEPVVEEPVEEPVLEEPVVEEIVEEPVIEEPVVEEPVEEPVAVPVVLMEEVNEEELAEAMAQPDVELEEISFIPDDDDQFEVAPEEPGIEVVGVVWPERKNRNKVYRYDPNGEQLDEGDIVLVPTRDVAKGRDVIRKVAVAHANHRVDPEHIRHPLKKIIAVVKRRVSDSLTPDANEAARSTSKTKRRK